MFGLPERRKENEADMREERRLMTLPVDCIRPNPYQPRRNFDEADLKELAASIREAGLIQPLVVQKTARSFELIAGERRLRACRMLGMREVPCVVQGPIRNDENGALMALIENVQRRDLNYIEEAECYRAVLRTYGMTQEELAARLGKSQAFLANKLRVLHLSPAVRRKLLEYCLTERHARALLRLRDERLQLEALERVREKGLNVKETERLVERVIAAVSAPPKPRLLRLLKDYRLFLNSVKCGAEQLRDTGLSVELIQTDLEDGVDMLVRVRRAAPRGGRADSAPEVSEAI
ncbi:MAG: ParB/RepB/Spo0J family partition protein [Clostridia bacterium]|nr:ParB/RepB/Spo0J family partition protein [Clostridia bacterium]